jgi:hypothetical protein
MNDILPPPAMLMHLAAGKFVTRALATAADTFAYSVLEAFRT